MEQNNTIKEILDGLASQNQQEETSLVFKIEPNLIQEAMTALRDYRKLFAPVIPGKTDIQAIYNAYESMRQVSDAKHFILLLVECQSEQELREALNRLPLRHSSEWRYLDQAM